MYKYRVHITFFILLFCFKFKTSERMQYILIHFGSLLTRRMWSRSVICTKLWGNSPWYSSRYFFKMVAQNKVRTYGVKQVSRFVDDIWLHRQSRHIRFFSREKPILQHSCATCSGLPSNICTMVFVLDGSSEHFAHVWRRTGVFWN